uniref:Uncharacterized protein n=1 Tax=Acrobeloides nanus TaxID=290746 RepID=A0A914DEL7_9BILA
MDSNQTNRVVLLPAGNTYYFFAVSIGNLENLRLKVEGIFKGSDNITEWERTSNGIVQHANLYIQNSSNIEITGAGMIDDLISLKCITAKTSKSTI